MAVFIGFAFRDATVSQSSYNCIECQMQGSSPLTKVPTQATRKERTVQTTIHVATPSDGQKTAKSMNATVGMISRKVEEIDSLRERIKKEIPKPEI